MLNTRRRRALACAGVTAALCAAIAPQALAGPLNAGGPVDLLTESNVRIGNLAAAAKVGDKIVSAGDFNGDGYKDVALGMWMLGADGPTRAAGRRGLRGLRQGVVRPGQHARRPGRPGHQRRPHRGRPRGRPPRLVADRRRRRQRRRQGRPADRRPVGRPGHARQDERGWRARRLRPRAQRPRSTSPPTRRASASTAPPTATARATPWPRATSTATAAATSCSARSAPPAATADCR